MTADRPFDRRLRRLRRDRAATRGDDALYLHRHAAAELADRLDAVTRPLADALVLGTASAGAAALLRQRGLDVTLADPGMAFARRGNVQCDEDFLPFADRSFDLIFALGTLDTVNDLPGALTLIRRALRPDGLLLAAFAGAGSLPRLRAAMLAADGEAGAAPRVHPQIDVRAAGDLLTRAGFALPVADTETIVVRFPSLAALVGDLRGMAATNMLAARDRTPIGRRGLDAARRAFAGAADPDGKTAEQFAILYLTGWAPAG